MFVRNLTPVHNSLMLQSSYVPYTSNASYRYVAVSTSPPSKTRGPSNKSVLNHDASALYDAPATRETLKQIPQNERCAAARTQCNMYDNPYNYDYRYPVNRSSDT